MSALYCNSCLLSLLLPTHVFPSYVVFLCTRESTCLPMLRVIGWVSMSRSWNYYCINTKGLFFPICDKIGIYKFIQVAIKFVLNVHCPLITHIHVYGHLITTLKNQYMMDENVPLCTKMSALLLGSPKWGKKKFNIFSNSFYEYIYKSAIKLWRKKRAKQFINLIDCCSYPALVCQL